MRFSGFALAACAAFLLTAAGESWAGGRSGSHAGASGRSSASHSGRHHHRHFRGPVFVGSAFYAGPAFYYYSYPYPTPYYSYPPPPPVYIQQPQEPVVPESQLYWYYCAGAKTYYPYIKDCPGGWQRVMPYPMQAPTG